MACIIIYTDATITEAQIRKMINAVAEEQSVETVTVKGKPKAVTSRKARFGEEGLVKLTEEEHGKLIAKIGAEATAAMIARLERYIGSKGDKYKSHYMTILNWLERDAKEGKPQQLPGQMGVADLIKNRGGRVI